MAVCDVSTGDVYRTPLDGSVSTDLIRDGRFSMLVAPFQAPIDVPDP